VLYRWRDHHEIATDRLVTSVVLTALIPMAPAVPALIPMAPAVPALIILVAVTRGQRRVRGVGSMAAAGDRRRTSAARLIAPGRGRSSGASCGDRLLQARRLVGRRIEAGFADA